jgi:putative acetyltransferase
VTNQSLTNQSKNVFCVEAIDDFQLAEIRRLFADYSNSLPFDLNFQSFDEELAQLPGKYAAPDGCLLLAYIDSSVAGCVGLRKIATGICEMKRLFVHPEFQGFGAGISLIKEIVRVGKTKKYSKMRLDTVPSMKNAIALYRSLGFVEIEPYCENPIAGAIFLELDLHQTASQD